MKYGEGIELGPKKKAIWFNGEIGLVDLKTKDYILLRQDEVSKLKEIIESENQSSMSKEEK